MASEPQPSIFVVDWYRPSQARDILKAGSWGGAGMLIGSLVFAWVFRGAQTDPQRWVAALIGVGVIVAGGIWTFRKMMVLLSDPRCLTLRNDGLLWERGGQETFVPWGDTLEAGVDPESGLIEVPLREGGRLLIEERFVGVTPEAIAKAITDVRRKALMGLLRPLG